MIPAILLASIFSVFSPARRDAKRGAEAYRKGRFSESARAFSESRRRDPADRAWALDLGTALAAAGGDADARARLVEAAGAADRKIAADALYQQGTLDLSHGRASRAVEALRASLLLDPARPDAKRNYELALRSPPRPKEPPPKADSRSEPPKTGPKPDKPRPAPPDDSRFEKRAGMTRQEAEALLRSLDLEQRQREKTAAAARGKDW